MKDYFYEILTSALDGCQLSASHFGRFNLVASVRRMGRYEGQFGRCGKDVNV